MQLVRPPLSFSNPVVLWQDWIPMEHHVPLYLSFFPSESFFFSEIIGKDICMGRLFTKSIYLPFFLTGLFSLHLLRLSKETLWFTGQLLPQLNGLFTSVALHMLPKTTAPLCGYSRGLHAPNSGCKSSLKKSFFFPRNVGLLLPMSLA